MEWLKQFKDAIPLRVYHGIIYIAEAEGIESKTKEEFAKEFSKLSEGSVLRFPNIGRKTLKQIRNFLDYDYTRTFFIHKETMDLRMRLEQEISNLKTANEKFDRIINILLRYESLFGDRSDLTKEETRYERLQKLCDKIYNTVGELKQNGQTR